MRKVLSVGLTVVLVLTLVTPALAETGSTPLGMLTMAEELLYGKPQTGPLVERLNKLEKDLFGETNQEDPLLVRINHIAGYMASGGFEGQSIKLRLNAAEWMIYQRMTDGVSIKERLELIESGVYGTPQQGPILERINNLVKLVWPSGELSTKVIDVPKETLVKIKLLEGVGSATAEKGDTVPYRVVRDVVINNTVVIPAGAEGLAIVDEVQKAGRLGRDGRLNLDFQSISAIDGSPVELAVAEKATEKNKSLELAAGASMAGVILLGPIGLAGAFFVKGKDVEITSGTEFFVEVKQAARVTGLFMAPEY